MRCRACYGAGDSRKLLIMGERPAIGDALDGNRLCESCGLRRATTRLVWGDGDSLRVCGYCDHAIRDNVNAINSLGWRSRCTMALVHRVLTEPK